MTDLKGLRNLRMMFCGTCGGSMQMIDFMWLRMLEQFHPLRGARVRTRPRTRTRARGASAS